MNVEHSYRTRFPEPFSLNMSLFDYSFPLMPQESRLRVASAALSLERAAGYALSTIGKQYFDIMIDFYCCPLNAFVLFDESSRYHPSCTCTPTRASSGDEDIDFNLWASSNIESLLGSILSNETVIESLDTFGRVIESEFPYCVIDKAGGEKALTYFDMKGRIYG